METPFKAHMRTKFPDVDVDKAISIFEDNISQIKIGVLEENREVRMPLGCDMNKNIFIKVLSEYNEDRYSLGDKVTTDYYENEQFEVVGIRKDELELRGDWSAMNNVIGDNWYPTIKCKKVKNGKKI